MAKHEFEFYETPEAFTHWLFEEVRIFGRVFEPCVGSGAIQRATWPPNGRIWFTNDLDPRWPADVHKDATDRTLWEAHQVDWTVTNPPFSAAIDILTLALEFSRVGVAMHLRASIHEVLKGPRKSKKRHVATRKQARRTWMADHPPTGILWLPRFGYQRSQTSAALHAYARQGLGFVRGRQVGQRVVYGSAEEAELALRQQQAVLAQRARVRTALGRLRVGPNDPRRIVFIEQPGDIARSLLYRVIR